MQENENMQEQEIDMNQLYFTKDQNLVFKNADKITPITSTINAATISLYQPPPMAFFAMVNMVLQLNRFTWEANPMTAILMV